MILIFVMSDDVITLVTGLHSCLVTGLHSWVTVSTYWVSHTVLCSVQQLGEDTGAGAGTDTDMSYIYKTGPFSSRPTDFVKLRVISNIQLNS